MTPSLCHSGRRAGIQKPDMSLEAILNQVQNDKKKVRDYETTRFVIPAAEPESIKPRWF
jgi:hypothetical protein